MIGTGSRTRRDDLRAAALFVVDDERRRFGSDARVPGSCDVAGALRTFDECLGVFALEDEVGHAIRSPAEVEAWRAVLERLEPVWSMWPAYAGRADVLMSSVAWLRLHEAVERVVDEHALWHEEVAYPVTVRLDGAEERAESWDQVAAIVFGRSPESVEDAEGRRLEVAVTPARVELARVGLPRPR